MKKSTRRKSKKRHLNKSRRNYTNQLLEQILKQNKDNTGSKIDYISLISLIISLIALIMSVKVMEFDTLSLISGVEEPILDIHLEEYEDSVKIAHKTHEIFDIVHVNFGKVRPFSLLDNSIDEDEANIYRSIDVPYLSTRRNFERGHTQGTDTPPKEAKKHNKSMLISLDDYDMVFEQDELRRIHDYIEKNISTYLEEVKPVYKFYDYFYLIIYYMDQYGNRGTQYYIYNHEYANTIKKYKLNEEEFSIYTSQIISPNIIEKDINSELSYEEKLLKLLISDYSRITQNHPKYMAETYDSQYNEFIKVDRDIKEGRD